MLGVGETGEAVAGVVLIEAGGEDTGDAEGAIARDRAERGELALRADDLNGVADLSADGVGEVFANDDGRDGLWVLGGGWGGFQLGGTALLDVAEEVADSALVSGDDACYLSAAGSRAAGDEHLLIEAGRGCGYVRQLAQAIQKRTPVADAVGGDPHELDVSGRADEALLEVALHAVGDGKGDDQRSDTGCDTNN